MPELRTIGKYKITGSLGRGGMGVVHRAFDAAIGRDVALKIIHQRDADEWEDGGLMARFRNEARAAGRLNHPAIVTVYDFGEEDGLAYIAMECVQGGALKDYLAQHGPMPVADVFNLMLQLLDGLDYAHGQGVIHRDIKPSNLLLAADGKLKIADFGVARIDNSNLTGTGSLIGTANYIAPELFLGQSASRQSDIFSTGVVFYELLTGQRPFPGPAEALTHQICNVEPSRPSAVAASVPPLCDRIALSALAKPLELRYASAAAFAHDLQATYVKLFDRVPSRAVSEETVMLTQQLRKGRPPTLGGSSGSGQFSTGSTRPIWRDEMLKTVERELTKFIGPVARVLVRKAAEKTTDRHRLYLMLADNLDDGARQPFLATEAMPTHGAPAAADAPGAPLTVGPIVFNDENMQPGEMISPLEAEQTRRLLAARVGPIAGVYMKQAARAAKGRTDFFTRIANNLTNDKERQTFLQDLARAGL